MRKSTAFHAPTILAAALIAFASAFAGWQLKGTQPAVDEDQLTARILTKILAELQSETHVASQREALISALKDEGVVDRAVDAGIKRYLAKQQEARRKAEEERMRSAREKAKKVSRVSTKDHIYGNPDAEISLIEYSDFECPFCKTFHDKPRQVVEAFEGKVNWVYRHFPLQIHNPGAHRQAEASECAAEIGGNEAFWKYTNLIYDRTASNGKGFPLNKLVPLAEEIGLESSRFQECLDSEKYRDRVQQDLRDGQSSGIDATPGTIILNNNSGAVELVIGAQPIEVLTAAVRRLLQ